MPSGEGESFGAAEKHFSFHSLEKILGLLACIIPKESTVSDNKIATPFSSFMLGLKKVWYIE